MTDKEWTVWAKSLCRDSEDDFCRDPNLHYKLHAHLTPGNGVKPDDWWTWITQGHYVLAHRNKLVGALHYKDTPALVVQYLDPKLKAKGSVDRAELSTFLGPYGFANDHRPGWVLGRLINRSLLARIIQPMTAAKLALWHDRKNQILVGSDGETRFLLMGLTVHPGDKKAYPSWPPKAAAKDEPGTEQLLVTK